MVTQQRRGRPRGLNLNPVATLDMLDKACMSKGELADAARITPGHLADMLYREKGTSEAVIRRMATALRCSPETLAPGLSGKFIAVRASDRQDGEVA